MGWSVRKTAKIYKVPRSTLYDNTIGRYKDGKYIGDRRQALDMETEQTLVEYLIYIADRGMPLTRKIFAAVVRGVVTKRNLLTPFKDDTPSYKWMRQFLKRHKNVALRTPDALDAARSNVDPQDVSHYQDLLEEAVRDKNPEQLFNCDETGFSGKESVRVKVLAKKGKKKVHQHQVKFPGHILRYWQQHVQMALPYHHSPSSRDHAPKKYLVFLETGDLLPASLGGSLQKFSLSGSRRC